MARIRILLGDDHTLVRHGLRKILEERPEWDVVGEAGDGRDAVRRTAALLPDVAILDAGMPVLNGIDATRQIVSRFPTVRVLILSMHSEKAAIKAGAQGYLLKDSADTELVRGVAAVAGGQAFFSPAVARVMLDDYIRRLAEKGLVDRFDSPSVGNERFFSSSPKAAAIKRLRSCCS
jgi:two-component system response regulator NreC